MDPCTVVTVGLIAGGVALARKVLRSDTSANQTYRTISDINQTRNKALTDMRTASRQFTAHVDRQTRMYRR